MRILSNIATYWAQLEIRIAKAEGYLGGPENEREEVSPRFDAISGVNCWLGRLMAAHLMV